MKLKNSLVKYILQSGLTTIIVIMLFFGILKSWYYGNILADRLEFIINIVFPLIIIFISFLPFLLLFSVLVYALMEININAFFKKVIVNVLGGIFISATIALGKEVFTMDINQADFIYNKYSGYHWIYHSTFAFLVWWFKFPILDETPQIEDIDHLVE